MKDDDKSGSAFGKSVAQLLKAHGWPLEEVAPVIQACPSSRDAKDLSDRAIERDYDSTMEPGAKRKGKSQREQIIDLGREFDFWMDGSGEHFVTYHRNGHYEHRRVRSQAFRDFLQQEHRKRGGSGLSHTAISEALASFEGLASDGPKHNYRIRVAEDGGKHYIDIGDETWQAIEFDADGWRVVDRTPIPIIRAKGTAALPMPTKGGAIELLRPYVHLASDDDFKLLVGFLVACLRASGPYPILNPLGQQGATKTTLSRIARLLIDPRGDDGNDVGPMPKTEDDFVVAARNAHLIAMDNLSRINDEQSDTMCRVSTGGTLTKRKLYTDGDVFTMSANRPQIVNGIPDLVQRPDLSDRTITLILPKREEGKRKAETDFWAAFHKDAPAILGVLLDGAVRACRDLHTITGPLPRMADFAKWAAASFPAFGWKPGDFLKVYETYTNEAAAKITESDRVAVEIIKFMNDQNSWKGSAGELLKALTDIHVFEQGEKDWPNDPTRLGSRLRRTAPGLRTLGIDVDPDHRSNGIRTITITKNSAATVPLQCR
jgi:putative DNA primase/helicase